MPSVSGLLEAREKRQGVSLLRLYCYAGDDRWPGQVPARRV
ncbi:hypothetical protein [Streptomyces sp. R35]|uniref:Uncharacterized protein n=1 Tax=Streptomyces sp. R35 TaxID=3238630 RepID=A0AB39SMM2_9ACTN